MLFHIIPNSAFDENGKVVEKFYLESEDALRQFLPSKFLNSKSLKKKATVLRDANLLFVLLIFFEFTKPSSVNANVAMCIIMMMMMMMMCVMMRVMLNNLGWWIFQRGV
jgi:hypothetical protein